MKKRLLPMVLVCCLLSIWLAAYAQADDIVASGDCGASGSDVKWSLDTKGNLAITGKGAMCDYGGTYRASIWRTYAPWDDKRGDIITLTVSEGITVIGSNAFSGLTRLTKVTLPDSLVRIKLQAFTDCTSLTKITLPNSVVSMGEENVFLRCSNLLSCTISENVTTIWVNSFRECKRLTKIVIPESVEIIDVDAFRECDRLQNVQILGNVSIIKARTFLNCPALEEITIPASVEIIEENAFSGCKALKDVYFAGTEDMWKNIVVDAGNEPLSSATVHCDPSAYRINGITVSGGREGIGAMPHGTFYATISITNRASGTSPVIFLATYSENGKFQDIMYVTVKEPVSATVEVTFPVDNSTGNITELKAFAVSSVGNYAPIGNPVSYP